MNYELKILDWGVGSTVGQVYGLGDILHIPHTHTRTQNFICNFISGYEAFRGSLFMSPRLRTHQSFVLDFYLKMLVNASIIIILHLPV